MSEPEKLTAEYKAALLQRQNSLQSEAKLVLDDLQLFSLLSPLGPSLLLGSAALGLMVWPDIDITVTHNGLTIDRVMEVMTAVYVHPRVKRVRYHNEVGRFNPSGPALDDRYFFMAYYDAPTGTEWKIDISFWTNVEEHPEPFYESVARQLTEETRLAILWIKDIWYLLPAYRTQVYSVDIYDAVLSYSVRTPSEFDEYLLERGKPAR